MHAKRIIIVINGSKKLKAKVNELIVAIEQLEGFQSKRYVTKAVLDAKDHLTQELQDEDTIIAVGGDGTCNEVINGMMCSNKKGLILGVIPAGTGNDFLRMCIPHSERTVLDRLKSQKFTQIDLGSIKSEASTHYFLNIADLGLGGRVIEIMNRQRKIRVGGKFSYASSIVRGFFSYKKPTVKIVCDSFEYEGKLMLLALCNGSVFGHGLTIYPEADLCDSRLGFTIVGDVTLYDYIKNLSRLKKGKHIDHPEAHYLSGTKLEVFIEEGSLPGEADGEFIPGGNSVVEIIPSAIRLVNQLN